MLTQTDLLERAKAGNPQAIADLMNLVLEPKGVTAKAVMQDHWLHLFFTSKYVLSQTSIVNFVQTGLLNLDTKAIQRVRLQAYRVGQPAPQWVTELWLHGIPEKTTAPTAQPNHPHKLPAKGAPTAAPKRSTTLKRSRKPPAGVKRRKPRPRSNSPLRFMGYLLWGRFKPRARYFIASTVGVGAFLVGGVVAILADSQAESQSSSVSMNSGAMHGARNQIVRSGDSPNPETVEAAAKQYLMKMNQAQKAFYAANSRFASSLEELERSASMISHSSHYGYKLAVRSDAKAVLTAIPKVEGLKSFVGTVVLGSDAASRGAVVNILCESQSASQVPPMVPQLRSGVLQCPPESIPVSN